MPGGVAGAQLTAAPYADHNLAHFRKVNGLVCVDWTRAP